VIAAKAVPILQQEAKKRHAWQSQVLKSQHITTLAPRGDDVEPAISGAVKGKATEIAAKAVPLLQEEAKKRQGQRRDLLENQRLATSVSRDTDVRQVNNGRATQIAAKAVGLSPSTVERAVRVMRTDAEEFERIERGETTVAEAERRVTAKGPSPASFPRLARAKAQFSPSLPPAAVLVPDPLPISPRVDFQPLPDALSVPGSPLGDAPSDAGRALASSVLRHDVERVAVFAANLPRILSGGTETAQGVLLACHRLKVLGGDAGAVPTQVVELESVWHLAHHEFVAVPMRRPNPVSHNEPAVALLRLGAEPHPAEVGFPNPRPEPLLRSSHRRSTPPFNSRPAAATVAGPSAWDRTH